MPTKFDVNSSNFRQAFFSFCNPGILNTFKPSAFPRKEACFASCEESFPIDWKLRTSRPHLQVHPQVHPIDCNRPQCRSGTVMKFDDAEEVTADSRLTPSVIPSEAEEPRILSSRVSNIPDARPNRNSFDRRGIELSDPDR